MATGFEQFSKIRSDPNLAPLRASPKFKPLLDKYDEPVLALGAMQCAFVYVSSKVLCPGASSWLSAERHCISRLMLLICIPSRICRLCLCLVAPMAAQCYAAWNCIEDAHIQ